MNPVKPDIKPPFKWTGGKNRMWEKYEPHFFPDKIDTFVDMFCGAGSVSLWIRKNYPDAKIVLNDLNSELIGLYRTFQNDYDAFEKCYSDIVAKFVPMEHADRKKFYYDLREYYCHKHENFPEYKLNAMLYFMLRTNFNGMWKAYKKCNLRYSTPPGTLTQKPKFFDLQNTRDFRDFLNTCELRSSDFGELTEWRQKGTYYYADPPYRDSIVEYQGGFNDDSQKRLVKFLQESSDAGCYIAESNKEIGDNFWETNFGEEYNFHFVDAKYTAGRGTSTLDVKEVLITNFGDNDAS